MSAAQIIGALTWDIVDSYSNSVPNFATKIRNFPQSEEIEGVNCLTPQPINWFFAGFSAKEWQRQHRLLRRPPSSSSTAAYPSPNSARSSPPFPTANLFTPLSPDSSKVQFFFSFLFLDAPYCFWVCLCVYVCLERERGGGIQIDPWSIDTSNWNLGLELDVISLLWNLERERVWG